MLRRAYRNLGAAKANLQLGYIESAASIAYYSMFYVASAFLAEEGLSFSKHSGIIFRLR